MDLPFLDRFSRAPFDACDAAVDALVAANPERCLWGSDWPHLMLGPASRPDTPALFDALLRAVPRDGARNRILVDNPAALFGFGPG